MTMHLTHRTPRSRFNRHADSHEAPVSRFPKATQGGFTLVETTVVIALLSMGFFLIRQVGKERDSVHRFTLESYLLELHTEVSNFRQLNGRLPESLGELNLDSRYLYDPVSGALLNSSVDDYCFRLVVHSYQANEVKFDIIAEPCGAKENGSIRLAIDEHGEIRELRPDEFAFNYEASIYRQSVANAQRNLAELLLQYNKEEREQIYEAIFSTEFETDLLTASILLDRNMDETIAVSEVRQFSQIESGDDPNLARVQSTYTTILDDNRFPEDIGVEWMSSLSDGNDFFSPTNVGYFLESISSDSASTSAMTAPLTSIELLVREKNRVAIQSILSNVQRQIDQANGDTITPRDAQLGTVLIELLVYKYR